MLAILLELAICLAIGAAAAWFLASTTSAFLIVMTAVAVGLWIVVRVVRHMRRDDVVEFSLATVVDAFLWWL